MVIYPGLISPTIPPATRQRVTSVCDTFLVYGGFGALTLPRVQPFLNLTLCCNHCFTCGAKRPASAGEETSGSMVDSNRLAYLTCIERPASAGEETSGSMVDSTILCSRLDPSPFITMSIIIANVFVNTSIIANAVAVVIVSINIVFADAWVRAEGFRCRRGKGSRRTNGR